MTHSPGPWSADLKHQGKIVGTWISKNGGGCNVKLKTLEVLDDNTIGTIAIINCESSPPSKEDKANARLIAAAPELLKIVQDFIYTLQDERGSNYVDGNIIHGKAAWVKATGETWKDAEYEEDENEDEGEQHGST